tara:strand:- start:647 stop:973 length:327 start_codon:yes stop_codon:yes gene_type:complete
MNWSKYAEKKGKTADFVKKEKELQPAKEEIKNEAGELVQAKTDAIKKEYIAYVCKCWDSETGEAMPDSEREYSLSQLENEKKRWDDEITRAKAQSDGLKLAIEDFKKL